MSTANDVTAAASNAVPPATVATDTAGMVADAAAVTIAVAATTAAPNPNSAIHKVFNLPELFENILLHVSEDGCTEPAVEYFLLQRVNRTFQAEIWRNKIIQQRMFLAAGTCHVHQNAAFDWLLDSIGIPVAGETMTSGPAACRALHRNWQEPRPWAQGYHSWRNMKICSAPLRFDCHSRSLEGVFCMNIRPAGGKMTLGAAYDAAQRMMLYMIDYENKVDVAAELKHLEEGRYNFYAAAELEHLEES